MKLHQLKIDFNAEQDRLLMLVSTDDGAEVRMWITRRFVKLLWPLLVKLAEEASPRIKVQASHDFLVFGTVAVASLSSGALLQLLSWRAVGIGAVPFLVLAAAGLAWLALQGRAAPPRTA